VAAQRARQLRRLQERLAAACSRSVDDIAADMRAGRLLSAAEAQEYGLIDSAEPGRPRLEQ
jgi:ATP-dependent Clp protease protease subunit